METWSDSEDSNMETGRQGNQMEVINSKKLYNHLYVLGDDNGILLQYLMSSTLTSMVLFMHFNIEMSHIVGNSLC